MNERPQQIVVIEYSKQEFNNKFYQLREEGYRATHISVTSSPVSNNAANYVFMALMEF